MALFSGPFRKKPPRDAEALERVRGWCLSVLGSEADLTISEVECADPACPGLETFILVMRPGEATQAAKVRKPLAAITETDIREALHYL
ncbi:MAG: hypothetical protein O9322_16490 [Beijerinckiaceae bacterium]|nr:hypothetical protein [Beijerinckiaceae bacterium]MCZ8300950.1 hypothetical protein [Beijerinckiaceae bacterium]